MQRTVTAPGQMVQFEDLAKSSEKVTESDDVAFSHSEALAQITQLEILEVEHNTIAVPARPTEDTKPAPKPPALMHDDIAVVVRGILH